MKYILAQILYALGLWPVFFWFYRLLTGRPLLVVFTFHRIVPEEQDKRFLQGYERGTRQSVFDRQIALIRRYFEVIDLDRFSRIVNGNRVAGASRPMALLTFDDVDSDHPARAFSRLIEHKLPAVAFVPTAFIESERRLYHLRLTNICNLMPPDGWERVRQRELPDDILQAIESFSPVQDENRREFRRSLIGPFEKLLPDARDKIIDGWEQMIDRRYELGIGCMNWTEIASLLQSGIRVGSHTVNHNRLALLDDAQVEFELAESRRVLEEKTGQPVVSICYPEGSLDHRTPAACRKAGYQLGFASVGRPVRYPLKNDQFFLIPRIDLVDGPSARIAWSLGVRIMRSALDSN